MKCTKCLAEKPVEEFALRCRGSAKRKPACKRCAADYARSRYHEKRDYYLNYAKESRKDKAVRARINERRTAHRRANPAKVLLSLAAVRARKFGLPMDIELCDVSVPEFCPVLGVRLEWGSNRRQLDRSPTLDRIIPERGYVKGNVCVISWRANRLKSDGLAWELRAVAEYATRAPKP